MLQDWGWSAWYTKKVPNIPPLIQSNWIHGHFHHSPTPRHLQRYQSSILVRTRVRSSKVHVAKLYRQPRLESWASYLEEGVSAQRRLRECEDYVSWPNPFWHYPSSLCSSPWLLGDLERCPGTKATWSNVISIRRTLFTCCEQKFGERVVHTFDFFRFL